MNQVCGIYKITNLVNGKSYIGQSVNISSRWKQHTQSLEKVKNPDGENPLRRAFLKYGLLQQVSEPGIHGNFKFEVLLECPREKLTEEEYARIAEQQPEYNRMMCPPSEDRVWPRKQNVERCCYVQYHNFEEKGYLPFEGFTDKDWLNDSGYTVTKKRDSLSLKGERVYLILGIKQKGHKRKDYFLWEYTLVEEVDIVDFGEGKEYGVRGTHYICKKPIRLNDLPGFEHFAKHTMGSFAYGFQNIINDPFHEFIEDESNFIIAKESGKSGLEWLADFEDELDDENLMLTGRDEKDVPYWNFFDVYEKDPTYAWVYSRAYEVLELNPDFFMGQFELFLKNHGDVKSLATHLCENLTDFAKHFPEIAYNVNCGEFDESWDDYVQTMSQQENVILRRNGYEALYFPKSIGKRGLLLLTTNRNVSDYWPVFELDEPPHKGWSRILVNHDSDCIGKRIYHIATLNRKGIRESYLWSFLDVKEEESLYEGRNFKRLWGPVYLCKSPIRLNDDHPVDKSDNLPKDELLKYISNEDLYTSLAEISSETEWLCRFEETNCMEIEWRDTCRNAKGKALYKAP